MNKTSNTSKFAKTISITTTKVNQDGKEYHPAMIWINPQMDNINPAIAAALKEPESAKKVLVALINGEIPGCQLRVADPSEKVETPETDTDAAINDMVAKLLAS